MTVIFTEKKVSYFQLTIRTAFFFFPFRLMTLAYHIILFPEAMYDSQIYLQHQLRVHMKKDITSYYI